MTDVMMKILVSIPPQRDEVQDLPLLKSQVQQHRSRKTTTSCVHNILILSLNRKLDFYVYDKTVSFFNFHLKFITGEGVEKNLCNIRRIFKNQLRGAFKEVMGFLWFSGG